MDEGITKSFNAKGGKPQKPVSPEERKRILQEIADVSAAVVPPAPDPAAKYRLMGVLMFSKSAYDDEFDRIHKQFLPLLNDLDRGKPRKVLFIDPSEYAGAKAMGIDTREYLGSAMLLNGVMPSAGSIFMTDAALSVQDKRTKGHNSAVTNPSANWSGNACVIVPLSHFGNTGVDLKGMTAGEISTYVNYHEFFHCMNDVYNADTSKNAPQKREMFADVGAALEMVRRGSSPAIIDSIIEWREKQTDASHHTVEGLKALKQMVNSSGVESIKKMSQKEVLALSYVLTDANASSAMGYRWLEMKEAWSTPGFTSKLLSRLFEQPNPSVLPKGFDPHKALEEKAMRMGGKVTPVTLALANGELQKEYRAQYDKTSGANEMYPQMMIATQDAFIGSLSVIDSYI